MIEFTLPLKDGDPRPIVHLDWNNVDAMLATGTELSIWNGSEKELIATGATVIQDEIKANTTYGEASGKLYEIHDFKLGELTYPTLHVICCPSDFAPCQMLMGTTMFTGLKVGVDGSKNELTIEIPDGASFVRNVVMR